MEVTKMAENGGLDSPMSSPYAKDIGPAPSAGDFYGPNMAPSVSTHQPTPGDAIPTKVQFGPGGFAPGPLDSPFTTATPINSGGGGDSSHGSDVLDTPMKDAMKRY